MAIYPVQYTTIPILASPAFPNGRVARRPVLLLTLIAGANRISCYGIVDSGADHCAFPRSFMQPLGLNPLTAPIEPTTGVGSANVPTHFVNIMADLQGIVQFPLYAGFTTGLDALGVGLLGQSGFFDQFTVHFRLAQGIYELEV